MGLVAMAAAILLIVAAVVLFLSDLSVARGVRDARRFDRAYEANRPARTRRSP